MDVSRDLWALYYTETMIMNVCDDLCTIQAISCRFPSIKRRVVAYLDGARTLPKREEPEITQVLMFMVKKNRSQNYSELGLLGVSVRQRKI